MIGVIFWHAHPRIGGISPHGVGIAVGFMLGGMLMTRHAVRRGISSDDVWNMLTRAVFGVIVGARLAYVVGHPGEYFGGGRDPLDILRIWEGGLVFYGGAFGGIAAAYPYARKHGLSFKAVLDSAAPGFPLGLIFGRIGDLIVADHLGGPSTLPWAFRFFPYNQTGIFDSARYVAHPAPSPACFMSGCHSTALYDLANVLVLLPVVLWLARKPRAPGFMIAFTATWYGGSRLFSDIARDAKYYLGLHGTQWASIGLILAGTAYMVRLTRRGAPEPLHLETASGAEDTADPPGEAETIAPAPAPEA